MPIYEYQCQQCGEHLEVRQGVFEDPLKICQKCGGALEKQWSLSGFQFKGAGWYVTDYAGKKESAGVKTDGEKTEKSPAAESTVKSDGASNTKSDTPAGAKKDSSGSKKD